MTTDKTKTVETATLEQLAEIGRAASSPVRGGRDAYAAALNELAQLWGCADARELAEALHAEGNRMAEMTMTVDQNATDAAGYPLTLPYNARRERAWGAESKLRATMRRVGM